MSLQDLINRISKGNEKEGETDDSAITVNLENENGENNSSEEKKEEEESEEKGDVEEEVPMEDVASASQVEQEKPAPKVKSVSKAKPSGKSKQNSVSRSKRAGIVFPVGRVERHLRLGRYGERLGKTAAVYLAAVLEYLSAEVLELSGNACRDNKRMRITPRHILQAVGNDEELCRFMCCSRNIIAGAGALVKIDSVLLKPSKSENPTSRKKKKSQKKGNTKVQKDEQNEENEESNSSENAVEESNEVENQEQESKEVEQEQENETYNEPEEENEGSS